MQYRSMACFAGLICVLVSGLSGQEVRVSDSDELRAALQHLTPGTTVLLNPGVYQGGVYLSNAMGTEGAPIVIQGTEPNAPPVFRDGGGQAFHLADCSHVVLRHIRVEGFPGNGINIDDGGHVHHNTMVLPDKWVVRILQETTDPQFQPCHGGVFEDNLVFYDSRVQVFINVGPGTSPETFIFRRSAWCDVEGERRPSLPVAEEGGVYLSGVGAEAYKRVQ